MIITELKLIIKNCTTDLLDYWLLESHTLHTHDEMVPQHKLDDRTKVKHKQGE